MVLLVSRIQAELISVSLEKRFCFQLKLDIAQCFPKIYTHTIEWAVKSKEFAKFNAGRGRRFESEFDNLMMGANYNETAGIIVGPEVSRIFAEILLQRVDVNICSALCNGSTPLVMEIDYAVRRYVDDYFVFANRPEVLEKVQAAIVEELAPYKLSLNLGKSVSLERPFSTSETAARVDTVEILNAHFNQFIERVSEEKSGQENDGSEHSGGFRPLPMQRPEQVASAFLRDIKRALKSNGAVFDTCSNYFLSRAKALTADYLARLPLKGLPDSSIDCVCAFLTVLVDVLFFLYSSSPKVRQTYVVSEILLVIQHYIEEAPERLRRELSFHIAREIEYVVVLFARQGVEDNIEAMNLLIVLRCFQENLIAYDRLLQVFGLELDGAKIKRVPKNFGYFQAVTYIYYTRGADEFKFATAAVLDYILGLFVDDDRWNYRADRVMLLFDLLCCPYVERTYKILLSKAVLRHLGQNNINARAENLVASAEGGSWFFDWDGNVDLQDVLHRKELRRAYS